MSRPRRRRPRVRAVAAAGLSLPLLVLWGCETQPSRSTLDVRHALDELEQLRAFGVAGVVARAGERGPIDGRYATRPERALVRAPVDAGSLLARVEVRRIGRRVWIRRAVVTTAGVTSGPGLLAVRAPGTAPFVAVARPDAEPATRIVDAYDPRVLLQSVVDAHVGRLPEASDLPDAPGRSTYELRPTAAQSRRLGLRLLTVTTSAAGRPERLAYMTTGQVRVAYRITPSASGPAVAAPPDGLVDRAATVRPLPDATSPYEPVGTVDAAGTTVTIGSSPGSDGGRCWKVLAPEGYRDIAEPRPSGGVCGPPLDGGPADRFAVALDGVAPTPFDLVAFLVPTGSSGTARRADGTTTSLRSVGDLLVATGPTADPVVLVTLSVPGARLVCGPGPVNSAGDLDDLSDQQLSALVDAPWNCTEDAGA